MVVCGESELKDIGCGDVNCMILLCGEYELGDVGLCDIGMW